MARSIPPESPLFSGDGGQLERLRFRLWQVMITILTIAGTVWIMLLGVPILSITAIALAKHILVALLVMGMDLYPAQTSEN